MRTIQQAMRGATADYKRRLDASTDAAGYDEVTGLAREILNTLPDLEGHHVGSMAAGLMLAATAYGEFGVSGAIALVKEAKRQRAGFRKPKKQTKRERGL